MKKHFSGFTLIELLVVIAIIGMLAAIVLASLGNAKERANVASRLESARALQAAIELYFADNGLYPSTCSGGATSCTSGQRWYSDGCLADHSSAWIPGLTPKYISVLPKDPATSNNTTNNCCYRYKSNGTDYKLQIGYQCLAHISNETYLTYPLLIDPTHDGNSNNVVDGTTVDSWAVYTRNGAAF